jgi:hypothetical protein
MLRVQACRCAGVLYACKGVHTLFTGQREREKEIEREREKEIERAGNTLVFPGESERERER